MASKADPAGLYGRLGLKATADLAAIKRAFKNLALSNHPDQGGNDEAFQAIRHAYDVLVDPERRRRYDETGDASEKAPNNAHAALWGLIGSILGDAIGKAVQQDKDPSKIDLVSVIVNVLERRSDEIRESVTGAQRAKTLYAKIVGRFKRKKADAEPNVLDTIARAHLASLDNNIAQLSEQLAQNQAAIDILKDYKFEFDQDMMRSQLMPQFILRPTSTFTGTASS